MRFTNAKDGEWIQPKRKGYKLACCDCGLVHKVDFRLFKRKIQLRVVRDNRSTGQVRRHMKKRIFEGRIYTVIPEAQQ